LRRNHCNYWRLMLVVFRVWWIDSTNDIHDGMGAIIDSMMRLLLPFENLYSDDLLAWKLEFRRLIGYSKWVFRIFIRFSRWSVVTVCSSIRWVFCSFLELTTKNLITSTEHYRQKTFRLSVESSRSQVRIFRETPTS